MRLLETGRRWYRMREARTLLLVVAFGLLLFAPHAAQAQGELNRRTKTKVAPAYPELARKANVTGTVKIRVVVAPDGSIRNSTVVGGHPLLVNAAVEALRKWKFEPAAEESTGIVEFTFDPR